MTRNDLTTATPLTAKQIRQQRDADRLLVIEALQGFGPKSIARLSETYMQFQRATPDTSDRFHDIRPDEAFALLARLGRSGASALNGWQGIKWDSRFLILLANQTMGDLDGLSEAKLASLLQSRRRLEA